jgi:hypothetical protein
MLNYLCGLAQTFSLRCISAHDIVQNSHEKAVKQIIRYLKKTPKEGIILKPDHSQGMQCYIDADFANGWSNADCEEPSSVYSRSGYMIMYVACPLI